MSEVLEDLTEEEAYLYAILTDESGIDAAEFCWRDDSAKDTQGIWRAWPFQWSWWHCTDTHQLDQCSRSVGKALDVDTLVPTPSGWTTMGELQVGDTVFGDDGRPTSVVEAFDVQEGRPCFEIVFDDGFSIVADRDHLWKTWTHRETANFARNGKGTSAIVTTGDILDTLFNGRRKDPNHRIEVAKPIMGEDADLLVTPYVLGYWLGDGTSSSGSITIGKHDAEVSLALLRSEGYVVERQIRADRYGVFEPYEWVDCPHLPHLRNTKRGLDDEIAREIRELGRAGYSGVELAKKFDVNTTVISEILTGRTYLSAGGPVRTQTIGLGVRLQELGVLSNKHIPDRYLRASCESRVALLQGLMDSDGTISKVGRCSIEMVNERLMRQVFELVCSLGQKPRWTEGRATYYGADCGPKYEVAWHPYELAPFRMPRKLGRMQAATRPTRITRRTIVDVRPVGSRPVRCIAVDSSSHMFLVGRNFVPTHNSTSVRLRGFIFCFIHPGQEMVLTGPETVHVEPITQALETQLRAVRLSEEMLIPDKRAAIKHRPFMVQYRNGARIMGRIPQRDGKGWKGCINIHEHVLSDRGYVLASDLRVGDRVLTHKNRFMPITEIQLDTNDCFEVKGAGSLPITVSCDHRFYGMSNVTVAKQKRKFLEPTWYDVEDLEEFNVYWASPTRFPVLPVEWPDTRAFDVETNDFWWLVGRYLADGCLTSRKNQGPTGVEWCAIPDKAEIIEEVAQRIGIHTWRDVRAHSSADMVVCASPALARWLEKFFGRHSSSKTMPAFVFGMDYEWRRALLDGYLSGDGHWNPKRNRWDCQTISHKLALSLQMLAQSVGYQVGMGTYQPKVTHIRGVELKTEPRLTYIVQIRENGHGVERDGLVFQQVKSVTPVGKQPVINLIVDEDHSYVSGSVVSHNIHPLWLEMDEAQDVPELAWKEIIETLKQGHDGAVWRIHGVTRGLRDYFYTFSQEGSGWTVHQYTAMSRPNWSDQEREDKIKMYGSRNSPDYRRNILGSHGDATSPLFDRSRLYNCVDLKEDKDGNLSDYNRLEYVYTRVNAEQLSDDDGIEPLIMIPAAHRSRRGHWWIGADIGYCVDAETEIFTDRGWLRSDEVTAGDRTLSINRDTGLSEWSAVVDVYREDGVWPMVSILGRSFDAVTTPHHRWLTRFDYQDPSRFRWKTTETLNSKDQIPYSVPRSDCPTVNTYSDDFVELVAWFWTEGCVGSHWSFSQSVRTNPDYVKRIDALMYRLFGDPGPIAPGPWIERETYEQVLGLLAEGVSASKVEKITGVSRWSINRFKAGGRRSPHVWSRSFSERHQCVTWHLATPVRESVREAAPDKVPSATFLRSLTADQLELFIRTSIDADGWRSGSDCFGQADLERVSAFEYACALAGVATSRCKHGQREFWQVRLRTALGCSPVRAARNESAEMEITPFAYRGEIWCPSIENHHNWLARRNGCVYFTGNTNHPTEILGCIEEADARNRKGEAVLRLMFRIHLERVSHGGQIAAIQYLLEQYKPLVFAMDSTGLGLPLFQDLQERTPELAHKIRGYNFSSKILVEVDRTVKLDPFIGDPVKDAGIFRNVLEASSDVARDLVDRQRIILPFDREILKEFEGQTWAPDKSGMDQYGRRRRFSQGSFHALDAFRMLCIGYQQYNFEQTIQPVKEDVHDVFFFE